MISLLCSLFVVLSAYFVLRDLWCQLICSNFDQALPCSMTSVNGRMHVQTLLICIGDELHPLDEVAQLLLSDNTVCCNTCLLKACVYKRRYAAYLAREQQDCAAASAPLGFHTGSHCDNHLAVLPPCRASRLLLLLL